VAASAPVKNIGNYPETESVIAAIKSLHGSRVVDADAIAREAGNARAANVVLVGVASALFPFKPDSLEEAIRETFARKGDAVVQANLEAFRHGQRAN